MVVVVVIVREMVASSSSRLVCSDVRIKVVVGE